MTVPEEIILSLRCALVIFIGVKIFDLFFASSWIHFIPGEIDIQIRITMQTSRMR